MADRWGALCECSWGTSADGDAGIHDLTTHVDAYGRPTACTGRDSYGQPCECPSHVPMPDDEDEDEESGAQRRGPHRVPVPPDPRRPVRP